MRTLSRQPNGWHGKKCAEILPENTQPRLFDSGLTLRLTRIYVRRNTWSARIKYKLLVTVDATRHACFSLEASFQVLTWHWVEVCAKPLYRSGVGWGGHWLLMVKFRIDNDRRTWCTTTALMTIWQSPEWPSEARRRERDQASHYKRCLLGWCW